MLDPKTPFQAAAIFIGGIAVSLELQRRYWPSGLTWIVPHITLPVQVIAYTVLDINRTTRLNEQPMTQEQLRQLEQMARDVQSRSSATSVKPC